MKLLDILNVAPPVPIDSQCDFTSKKNKKKSDALLLQLRW